MTSRAPKRRLALRLRTFWGCRGKNRNIDYDMQRVVFRVSHMPDVRVTGLWRVRVTTCRAMVCREHERMRPAVGPGMSNK